VTTAGLGCHLEAIEDSAASQSVATPAPGATLRRRSVAIPGPSAISNRRNGAKLACNAASNPSYAALTRVNAASDAFFVSYDPCIVTIYAVDAASTAYIVSLIVDHVSMLLQIAPTHPSNVS
jgi:hypothetical protein